MHERLFFRIWPRHPKGGFNVASETLGFLMWHSTLDDAIDYAKAQSRGRTARIEISNATGEIVQTVEVEPQVG